MSTRSGPDTSATIASSPSSVGATKTSDLTIWPSSAPTAAAASCAVWVDSSKTVTSRVTPLRAAASMTRRTAGWSTGSGTARSLASVDGRTTGRRAGSPGVASRTMQAIVLADGDVAPRARIDEAWPGWADPAALVVAADGGRAARGRSGPSADRSGSATAIRSRPATSSAWSPTAPTSAGSAAAKDESDTELALVAAIDRGADDVVILGALGGARVDHALANVGLLAHPATGRSRRAVLLDASARVSFVRAPAPDGSPIERALPGRVGDLVSLLPTGGRRGGRHHARAHLPADRRAAARRVRPGDSRTCGRTPMRP